MFNREPAVDLDQQQPTIIDRLAAENRSVIPMRPSQRTPLENTAGWVRNLRYEDMMQMATEMHGIKAGDAIDTPEQLAKLLHSWAKATTEPAPDGAA